MKGLKTGKVTELFVQKAKSRAVFIIFFTVILDIAGIGIIFPIMPDLLEYSGLGNVSSTAIWGGILYASYAFMQFLFSPVIGNLSDSVGRRPVILISLILMILDYLLLGFASSIWIFLIGRMIGGIAGGTVPTAMAFLADISSPNERTKNFGLIGAAFGIGFIFGPAIGGVLGEINFRAPFFAAAGFALINLTFAFFFLPESLDKGSRRSFSINGLNPFNSLLLTSSFRETRIILGCFFLIKLSSWVYPAIWSFWGKEVFGWSSGMIGFSLACYGVGIAMVQGLIIRLPVVARLGATRVILISILLGSFALICFGFTRVWWIVFLIIPFSALSELLTPTLDGFMSNRVSKKKQGLLQGLLASITGLTSIFGPLIMTAIFGLTTSSQSGFYLPGAAFIFAAFLLLLALVPLLNSMKKLQNSASIL